MLTKDDGSKIIVCEECHEKIKEQENPKCKECSLAPNLPYFKCNHPNDNSIYCLHPSNCWAKVEKDFREREAANKHLTFVKTQEDLKNVGEAMVKWDKEKNAWVYLLKGDEIVWQPPQEEKQEQPEQQRPNRGEPQQQPNPRENEPDNLNNEPPQQPEPNSPNNQQKEEEERKLNYCKSCNKKYERGQANEAFYYLMNNEFGSNFDGILCSNCWDKEETQYRKITSNYMDKTKPKAIRKEYYEKGILAFIVYNWNKEKWVYAHANEDLGSPDNQRPKQRQNVPNEYTCGRCNTSCWNEKKGVYTIRRIWQTDLNFREEVHYFSENCSCAEEFKRQHQQTCAQCQKREWPDMKKGWALDYGLKTIFCSPMCHYKYHKNLWEQEQRERNRGLQSYTPGDVPNAIVLSWLEKTKLYPMELELSSGDKTTTDKGTSKAELEKIASKKEILTLKEFSKSLKKESVKSTTDPKLSKEEKQMANYFLKLAESSEAKAEADFESKYGKAELNSLLTGSNQEQPKKNYWPLIIGGGLAVVSLIVGLVIYFVSKKKKANDL